MRYTKLFLDAVAEKFGTLGHHTLFVQNGVLFLRIIPGDGKTYDYSIEEVDMSKDIVDLVNEIAELQAGRGA